MMPQKTAKNSMRMRLILIPATILGLGILAAIAVTLFDAKTRITSEITSGIHLGNLLIGYALEDLGASNNPDPVLQRLRSGLAHVRHIKVTYAEPDPATGVEAANFPPADASAKQRTSAPGWFLRLFEPERTEAVYKLSLGGVPRGTLVMSSEPADEVAEIWGSLAFLTTLLTTISIAIVMLIWFTARHTLKPVDQLVEGLDRLGRGQFDEVAEIRIAELSRIGEQFNKLAGSLARTEADNHLLIDRLLSIQDAERRELARELHDEFGASLFGIRAAASCIIETAGGITESEKAAEIIGRAEVTAALADAIQKQNYRILERIRPVILHQLGLADALRNLVESWCAQHRGFVCTVEIPAELCAAQRAFTEDVSLTSYRIVQECLTNIARHSKAKLVRVAMNYCSATKSIGNAPGVLLSIEDDGIGLPPEFKFGFGFLGMIERVRKLGGQLKIANGAQAGTVIEALIPLGEVSPAE